MNTATITPVNLFAGFLGVGKTTLLKHLLAHRPEGERWAVIVNEFGEIGIDGAVLEGEGAEVREIAGGCLCCVTGPQLPVTIVRLIREHRPHRLLIETSGLAHVSTLIDTLRAAPLGHALDVQAVWTLVDPRQFNVAQLRANPVYRDQITAADVLLATKSDLCDADTLAAFQAEAEAMFPPKAVIAHIEQGQADHAWLDLPARPASRYRPRVPESTTEQASAGWTWPTEDTFQADALIAFFDQLAERVPSLLRAKGIFQVGNQWLWFNWTAGHWGAAPVAWRRDSRFELIAESAAELEPIGRQIQACLEKK